MSKTVLVIGAHSDDETLGAGGAIARHIAEGDTVYAMMFTTGLASRDGLENTTYRSDEQYSTLKTAILRREEHADAAARVLGFSWYARHDMPDNAMDTVPLLDVVKHVEEAIDDLKPELVYTHHGGDLNIDHAVVYRAVMTATRPLPEQIVREVRLMEVPSSTEFSLTPFVPNLWVELTPKRLKAKMDALECYVDEVRDHTHPRSTDAVATLADRRGYEGGYQFAEAFNVVRRRL